MRHYMERRNVTCQMRLFLNKNSSQFPFLNTANKGDQHLKNILRKPKILLNISLLFLFI